MRISNWKCWWREFSWPRRDFLEFRAFSITQLLMESIICSVRIRRRYEGSSKIAAMTSGYALNSDKKPRKLQKKISWQKRIRCANSGTIVLNMKQPNFNTSYSIFANSFSRGQRIFESFPQNKQHLFLSEIHKIINISKSTVFRLPKALTQLDHLKFGPENKKYFLGPSGLSFGFSVLQNMETREIARPHMERLSRECH